MVWILLTPLVQFFASLNFPFIFWPEMLNWPYLLTLGWLPYRDFTTIITPILPITLALSYKFFGFDPQILHFFGALLLTMVNFLIVLFIFKNTGNKLIALLSGFLFIYLSLAFEGNHVWYDSLLVPFFLGAFWCQFLYLKVKDTRKIFLSGILIGLALLIKQTALYGLPATAVFFLYLFFKKKYTFNEISRLLLLFSAPVVSQIIVFLVVLNRLNILGDFWNWGVRFVLLKPNTLWPHPAQLLLLLILITFTGYLAFRKRHFAVFFPFVWMCSLTLLIFPRFAYFHFLPALSFFVITTALSLNTAKARLTLVLPFILVSIIVMPLFIKTYQIGQRFLTPENREIAAWLRTNYPKASIFSLNGPDIVYFLSAKPPAVRPWVDQLPWQLEFSGRVFIGAFLKSPPDLVITSPYLSQPIDGLGAYQQPEVVSFVYAHYRLIKVFSQNVMVWQRI